MEQTLGKTVLFIVALASFTGVTSFATIHVYAQGSHSEADSTSVAAVIIMTTDDQGSPVFNPAKTTIKQGEEVLVLNNLTKTHSFTNGNGTGDSMDSKIFSVEIAPRSFSRILGFKHFSW